MVLRWMVGIIALVMLLSGVSHLRLRIRRRQAYANGRDKHGTVRLHQPFARSTDTTTAVVIFATRYAEWIMTLDANSISGLEEKLVDGLAAKAWLGDDDHIYALDIGDKRTLPISAGMPFTGKLKDRVSKAEQRMARMAERGQARTES